MTGGHVIPGLRPITRPDDSRAILFPTSEIRHGPSHLSEPATMTIGHHRTR